MAGIWCPRCKGKVILEQDGLRCSNCGQVIVGPPTPARANKPPRKR